MVLNSQLEYSLLAALKTTVLQQLWCKRTWAGGGEEEEEERVCKRDRETKRMELSKNMFGMQT